VYPSFSPNGSKIVFVRGRDGNYEIYVMNADGSGQTRLTNNSADDVHPSFSPDGSKIAFDSQRDGNYEIYVMNANGSGQVNLTHNSASDDNPAFSPDGSKIAFDSDRDGGIGGNVYVMNADGSGQTRLTNNPADDYGPNWQPIPVPAQTKIDKAKINKKQGKARFRFSASGPNPATGFECKLNRPKRKRHHSGSRRLGLSRVAFRKAKFRPCNSPKKYKHLRPGRYTFFVRAIDVAGPDPTPAKRRFRITG
jgi:dipeptidyl aminopeptidase/acylaminoacyl peptidase